MEKSYWAHIKYTDPECWRFISADQFITDVGFKRGEIINDTFRNWRYDTYKKDPGGYIIDCKVWDKIFTYLPLVEYIEFNTKGLYIVATTKFSIADTMKFIQPSKQGPFVVLPYGDYWKKSRNEFESHTT